MITYTGIKWWRTLWLTICVKAGPWQLDDTQHFYGLCHGCFFISIFHTHIHIHTHGLYYTQWSMKIIHNNPLLFLCLYGYYTLKAICSKAPPVRVATPTMCVNHILLGYTHKHTHSTIHFVYSCMWSCWKDFISLSQQVWERDIFHWDVCQVFPLFSSLTLLFSLLDIVSFPLSLHSSLYISVFPSSLSLCFNVSLSLNLCLSTGSTDIWHSLNLNQPLTAGCKVNQSQWCRDTESCWGKGLGVGQWTCSTYWSFYWTLLFVTHNCGPLSTNIPLSTNNFICLCCAKSDTRTYSIDLKYTDFTLTGGSSSVDTSQFPQII